MKTVFNIVLGVCAIALVYICYASIMGPINFEKAKKHRDKAVRGPQEETTIPVPQTILSALGVLVFRVLTAVHRWEASQGNQFSWP